MEVAPAPAFHVVIPGDEIENSGDSISGHGTWQGTQPNPDPQSRSKQLVSVVAGNLEGVNKLLLVRPCRGRYQGQVADLVLGRVTELRGSTWRVDIGHRLDAVLPLTSVMDQRRKTVKDELTMRIHFQEGDLVCAQIVRVAQEDGRFILKLHKEGQAVEAAFFKLRYGSLVHVPWTLIKQSKNHVFSFDFGVDCVLGKNGAVWVAPSPAAMAEMCVQAEEDEKKKQGPFEECARVRTIVTSLARRFLPISQRAIEMLYYKSVDLGQSIRELHGDAFTDLLHSTELVPGE
eukprot:gnl/Trimastix_PCT/3804.p1 GENE.gnl/Trimastix_PCT/3804~~gnl/Trimastix_PCT/3804.p1  ORF type:complete len:301 (-),score=91.96 gnl/Trimastix_PCT/3804:59-925(-)